MFSLFKLSFKQLQTLSKTPKVLYSSPSFKLLDLIGTSYHVASSAGKLISQIYESKMLEIYDKSKDNKNEFEDIQTKADLKSQKLIIGSLKNAYPNIPIVGEEGKLKIETQDIVKVGNEVPNTGEKKVPTLPEDYNELNPQDLIIWVDPLDGTKEFTEGIKEAVTCLIGISYNNKPIAGIINRPFYNSTIYGIVGYGSYGISNLNINPNTRDKNRTNIITTRSHFSNELSDYINSIKCDKIIRYGGCGAKILMLLEGHCDAYVFPSKGTKLWDTCAGEAILLSEGGLMTKPDGKSTIEYNRNKKENGYQNIEGFIATWCGGEYHQQFCKN